MINWAEIFNASRFPALMFIMPLFQIEMEGEGMEEEHYEDAEEEMQEDQPGTDDDNDVVIVGKKNHHMAGYSMIMENRLFTYNKI